jgi:hypothetical protein
MAKKAGEVKDDVYHDNKHSLSFGIPSGWSTNIKSDKHVVRLTMDQKSPVPPFHFRGELQDYMQIPTMVVIVDTTSFGVDEFIDSLMSPTYETKQLEYFLKYLKILSRPHEILKRNQITFKDETAVIVEARQAYEMTVSERGSDRASVVNDFKYGSIFFTVRDGYVYIIHMICEYETSAPILKMFNSLVNSLAFGVDEGAETSSEDEG